MFGDFDVFYRAAQLWLMGQSPYTLATFFNPIWSLIPVIPLTLLPLPVARVIWTAMTMIGISLALWRFGIRSWIALVLLVLTPQMWLDVLYGNLDWLVLFGATLKPAWGIWLLVIKPQMGGALAVLWLYQAIQRRDWREVGWLTLPLLVWLASVVVFGLPNFSNAWNTASLFPLGVPVGVWLWRKRERPYALAAGPFLSVYSSPTSWIATLPLIGKSKRYVALIAGSWVAFAIWLIRGHLT